MYNRFIEYGFQPIIIATKADKINRSQLKKHIAVINKKLRLVEGTPVVPFSSHNGSGRDELWEYVSEFVEYFSEEEESDED